MSNNDPNYGDARKRSVDNLQRLYTVVVSLAVTESLRRTLLTGTQVELDWSNKWVLLLSLIFTVIPFYHGANRYLDATYVTNERIAKRYSLMFDFILLFTQGLLLFTLALFITNEPNLINDYDTRFFIGLAILLFVDVVWVGISRRITSDRPGQKSSYPVWAFINIVAIIVILILALCKLWALLIPLTLIRTVLDYLIAHDFYYPPNP